MFQAETINFENGKIKVSPVGKKDISIEKIDKNFSALIFNFPNVRVGSVIEYKFKSPWASIWFFQGGVPVRYSEIETEGLARAGMGYITYVNQPFAKNSGDNTELAQVKALANIHSLSNEPYMGAFKNNLERLEFFRVARMDTSWDLTAKSFLQTRYFSNELTGTVSGEGEIVKKARLLKPGDDQIAFLFDTVKNFMKWNDVSSIYQGSSTADAWNNRTGNSADINLVVLYLLKRASIKALPMLISTRNNGKIDKKILQDIKFYSVTLKFSLNHPENVIFFSVLNKALNSQCLTKTQTPQTVQTTWRIDVLGSPSYVGEQKIKNTKKLLKIG